MLAICHKEIRQFFSNLTGYIAILLFLLLNGIFLFVLKDSSLFETGMASLDGFFNLAPRVLLFLVPAISMRSLADEYRGGTFEILQTRPLTRWDIVMGKYVSLLIILLIVLIPTLLYPYTIRSLSTGGSIDGGAIAGSYFGLFLLGAVFAAISLFCSSITKNAVVTFLLSVFACLVLYFGFSALSRLPVFASGADYYIEMIGIDFHYHSISRGVIDSRDIIYFASVIFLFLFLTVKNLDKK